MRGYFEGKWVNEPATIDQIAIIEAFGFSVPEDWCGQFTGPESWNVGAFDRPIVVRLPYNLATNAILKAHGFTWDATKKEWVGSDNTKSQVEILQALSFLACKPLPGLGDQRIHVGAYA